MKRVSDVSWETLMNQASTTANQYFYEAMKTLNDSGMEFSVSDVISLASIAERDFRPTVILTGNQEIAEELKMIGYGLCEIAGSIAE